MIEFVLKEMRAWRDRRSLAQLKAHSHADDLPSQALKIAAQRSMGTRIGKCCRFLGRVDALNPQLIEIGNFCVLGTESVLLAHGPGFNGISRTVIGDYTYIGYRVTVLPGVSIGSNCIIGAGAVVTRDIPSGKVAAGNPARVLRDVTPEEASDIKYRMENNMFFGKAGIVS